MDELFKITILLKLLCGCTDYDIRGVKDTDYKIWACYLAKKLTNYSDNQLASFFKIHPHYMNNGIEDLRLQLLLHDKYKILMNRVEIAFNELQEINKAA
tara:strand:+ start:185 stop:481 length:297 start_codon:yes stop_codon:yes gene_type:complete